MMFGLQTTGPLADWEISNYCHSPGLVPMIDPFVDHKVRESDGEPVISYGLSSFGYDMRLANEFYVFVGAGQADPKNFRMPQKTQKIEGPMVLKPHGYCLASTVEKFFIPNSVVALVIGKSTYARAGVLINCTPMEPGWSGYLTLEIANLTSVPVVLYPGEGIAQAIFFRGQFPKNNYGQGKYQDQAPGPQLSEV